MKADYHFQIFGWIRQRRIGLFIAFLVALLMLWLEHSGLMERAEYFTYDMRMAASRVDTTPHPDIAVILIDEASLQAMNALVGRFPWPREVYADLLDYLALAGARNVVFDILLTERDAGGGDRRLVEATLNSGNVTHAIQLFHDPYLDKDSARPLPSPFVQQHGQIDEAGRFESFNNQYVLPHEELYAAASVMGVVDVEPDSDGIFRRMRLFHEYDGQLFPALSMAPLRRNGSASPSYYEFDAKGDLWLADQRLPIDPSRRVLVNHVEELNAYSFAAVYASLQALHRGDLAGLVVPPDEFEDKIVYLGASAVGLADIKATPLSPKAPGVTLHVSLLSNMLTGEMITDAPAWHVSLLVVVFVSLTAILVLAGKGMLVQSSTPFILSLVYVGWAWWQFQQHVVYNMATPLGAIMLTAFALWAFIAATEGRDKRRVRAMFSQYVSPAVLGQLTDGEHNVIQAEVGQMERLTVLFSDVRGFTGISEQLEPAQVVELLNIHFSVMSEVIFDHNGTLDKFIGDAIMAFWGAPIRVEHHAELAVRAAVEMERGLLLVNRQLQEKGYPTIAIGIGLNTGDSILGNIGSFRKLDYTVIGDTVNIASRLEGLTKLYGQGTIISEYTLAELPQGFPCAILDLVRVKGKEQPLAIHAPLGLPEDEAAVLAEARQLAEQIYAAFAAYRARHWDEAIRLYRALPESQAVLQQLFISRCEGFKLSEPAVDWDGVYTLQSK